jgi:protein-S-isoprenylcysteine O-methyltransferase Ste14
LQVNRLVSRPDDVPLVLARIETQAVRRYHPGFNCGGALVHERKPLLSRKLRIGLLRAAFVPVVLCALFGWRSWQDASVTDFVVEWSGYVFLMAGIGIRLWSTMYIGGRKSKQLVTDGPYSLCRNPLYVGTVLLAVGASLCLENVLMLLVSLAIMIPVHAIVTVAEERHLEELFGDQFREYKRSVPRFFGSSLFRVGEPGPAAIAVGPQAESRPPWLPPFSACPRRWRPRTMHTKAL